MNICNRNFHVAMSDWKHNFIPTISNGQTFFDRFVLTFSGLSEHKADVTQQKYCRVTDKLKKYCYDMFMNCKQCVNHNPRLNYIREDVTGAVYVHPFEHMSLTEYNLYIMKTERYNCNQCKTCVGTDTMHNMQDNLSEYIEICFKNIHIENNILKIPDIGYLKFLKDLHNEKYSIEINILSALYITEWIKISQDMHGYLCYLTPFKPFASREYRFQILCEKKNNDKNKILCIKTPNRVKQMFGFYFLDKHTPPEKRWIDLLIDQLQNGAGYNKITKDFKNLKSMCIFKINCLLLQANMTYKTYIHFTQNMRKPNVQEHIYSSCLCHEISLNKIKDLFCTNHIPYWIANESQQLIYQRFLLRVQCEQKFNVIKSETCNDYSIICIKDLCKMPLLERNKIVQETVF